MGPCHVQNCSGRDHDPKIRFLETLVQVCLWPSPKIRRRGKVGFLWNVGARAMSVQTTKRKRAISTEWRRRPRSWEHSRGSTNRPCDLYSEAEKRHFATWIPSSVRPLPKFLSLTTNQKMWNGILSWATFSNTNPRPQKSRKWTPIHLQPFILKELRFWTQIAITNHPISHQQYHYDRWSQSCIRHFITTSGISRLLARKKNCGQKGPFAAGLAFYQVVTDMEKELEKKGSRKYPQGKSFFLLSFLTVLPAARPEGIRVKNMGDLGRKRYKGLTQFHCRPWDFYLCSRQHNVSTSTCPWGGNSLMHVNGE